MVPLPTSWARVVGWGWDTSLIVILVVMLMVLLLLSVMGGGELLTDGVGGLTTVAGVNILLVVMMVEVEMGTMWLGCF